MTWDCDSDTKYHSFGYRWAHCLGLEEECITVEFRGADWKGDKAILRVYRSWEDRVDVIIRRVGEVEYYDGPLRKWSVEVLGISGTDLDAKAAIDICYEVPPCYVRGFAYDRDGNPVSGATIYFKGIAYLTGANGYTQYVECVCESGLHTASIVPPDGYTWFGGIHTRDYLCVEGYSEVRFPLVAVYVPPPYTLFQYEIAFDARVSNNPLYIAEQEKYERATAWWVGYSDPDCWSASCSNCADFLETHADGWLCGAVEYGESPCAPLPWWVCPFPTPETHYIRGECSCSVFQEELQGSGIPCAHLMAAYDQTVGELPWCPYIPCG